MRMRLCWYVIGVLVATAGAVGALAGEPAAGPHFIFKVPVNLSALPPEIKSFGVQCDVANSDGPSRGRTIGSGVTPTMTPITGGAYSGEVDVPVTLPTGADPATAAFYECVLSLRAVIDGKNVDYYGTGSIERQFIPIRSGQPSIRTTRIPPK